MTLLTLKQRAFLATQRVGHLATADALGQPHVVPVCYACDADVFYIALDAKPKRVGAQQLKRVRNLLVNPQVALVIDRYTEDCEHLAYVLIRGTAVLLPLQDGEHARTMTCGAILLITLPTITYISMQLVESVRRAAVVLPAPLHSANNHHLTEGRCASPAAEHSAAAWP